MKGVFVSYSRRDWKPVSEIASGLEKIGYEVWWDHRLQAGQDFGKVIEAALREANCAVVAWSRTASDSIWVRAEATEALQSGKLVQLSLDGAEPPLPFTMVHFFDFSRWSGQAGDPPWRDFSGSVESVMEGEMSGQVSPERVHRRLGGFEPIVVAGAASVALVLAAAGIVGLGAGGTFSPNVFGVITGGMFLTALLSFTHMMTRVIKIALASR